MIVGIRTDKPESELLLLDKERIVDTLIWHAHRQLSDTLLIKIEELLSRNGCQLSDVTGVIAYEGPGSFTGLRIGLSVANTLAYACNIPIAAAGGEAWPQDAYTILSEQREYALPAKPHYGSEANITKPRK